MTGRIIPSQSSSLYYGSDVTITARINDLDCWNNIKNISRGVCYKNGEKDEWYVTARAPSDMLDKLQKAPFVISLKLAEQVGPTGPTPSSSDTPSVTPTPLSEKITPPSLPKIDCCDVFDYMRAKICLVQSSKEIATGFFVDNRGLLVTAFHCLQIVFKDTGMFEATSSQLAVTYKGTKYEAELPEGFNVGKGVELDLCVLRLKNSNIVTEFFKMPNEELPIKEGMKAYFAGYHLTQPALTFHKRLISSIFQQQNVQQFTVDGTTVQGNSGSPVILQSKGQLYLVGVIFAGVAKETNISTGIGKIIHIQHVSELFTIQNTLPITLTGPVQTYSPTHEVLTALEKFKVTTDAKELVASFNNNNIISNVLQFLEGIASDSEKKKELYSKCWGEIGTIYDIPNVSGGRLAIQSPDTDAHNLQIQIGSQTIATVLVDFTLKGYGNNESKTVEVVNYLVYQFIQAIKHYQQHGEVVVYHISMK